MEVKQNVPVTEEVVDINEIIAARREKLAKLIESGKNPFEKVKYEKTHLSSQVVENAESLLGQTVSVAGRIIKPFGNGPWSS